MFDWILNRPQFKAVLRKTLNFSTRKVYQFPSHQITDKVDLLNFYSDILKLKIFMELTLS